jgi:hypothetical protein
MMWYDALHNNMYEWGGWPDGGDTDAGLWSTNIDDSGRTSWTAQSNPRTDTGDVLANTFGSAWTSSPSHFYSLSGVLPVVTNYTTSYFVNFSVQGLCSWSYDENIPTNTSSEGSSRSGLFVFSHISFVPNFGEAGVLIVYGGETPLSQSYDYGGATALTDMTIVYIYDIATRRWFNQVTSGEIPPKRRKFCSAGTTSAQNDTYEM